MRASMDDVLDAQVSFDLAKARETGAFKLIKRHTETIRDVRGKNGETVATVRTTNIELMSSQDATKEIVRYLDF